jgi:hypothetical protein
MSTVASIENYCFLGLLGSCGAAVVAWTYGMFRRKPFGAIPAAIWVALLALALVCGVVIAVIEFLNLR